MSTLEKFGILVILILVVIIGVVAVWGVGGEEKNPFTTDPTGESVTALDPVPPVETGSGAPGWPSGGPAPTASAPVPPPPLGSLPTPSSTSPNAALVAPPMGGTTTYTVQKGDTGEGIARKTGIKWPLISDINNKKDARKLKIGEVLKIPGGGTSVADTGLKPPVGLSKSFGEELPRPPNPSDGPTETAPVKANAAPEASPREVEVRNGDTLYEIARRELGDPNLYYKILKANPGLDPKRLKVGMKVKVPVL